MLYKLAQQLQEGGAVETEEQYSPPDICNRRQAVRITMRTTAVVAKNQEDST